jgi:uncharacterized protein YjiS (DUF1127 family)
MFGYDIFLSENPGYEGLLRQRNEARAAAFYASAKPLRAAIGAGVEAVRRWRQEREVVRDLSALSNRLLQDIGVSRADIRTIARSFAQSDGEKRNAAEILASSAPTPLPRAKAPRLTAIEGGRKAQPAPVERPAAEQRQVAVGCG